MSKKQQRQITPPQQAQIAASFDPCFQHIWKSVEKKLVELVPELFEDNPQQQELHSLMKSAYQARLKDDYIFIASGCYCEDLLPQGISVERAIELAQAETVSHEEWLLECAHTPSDMLRLLGGDDELIALRNMANETSLMTAGYLETPPDQRQPIGFRERRRLQRDLSRLVHDLPAWATTDAEEYILSIRNDIAVISGKRGLPGIKTLNLMGRLPDDK